MISKVIPFRTKLFINLFLIAFMCGSMAQKKKDVSNNIDSQYHPNVIGISNDGIVKGRDAMKTYLRNFYSSRGSLEDSKTHYKIPVYDGILEYEIGSFKTQEGGQFSHTIIWTKGNSSKQKIVEVVYENTSNSIEIPAELESARKKWVKLCNDHNSKKLVTQLYTEDAIYYNRGRLLRGHDQLSQEYSYMDNATYKLQLTPKHIEQVSDDIIFEIGKCSGSYNLPYLLVWKKQKEGNWKIYMDSNY